MLQVGTVVSWGSQEIRGLVIRVVATDYTFYHGEGNTNTPGKLSGGNVQVDSPLWEGLCSSRLPHGYYSLVSWFGEI